ncbi:MAG: hypothetical protein AAF513_00675 [Pseudomonadota bacterium]
MERTAKPTSLDKLLRNLPPSQARARRTTARWPILSYRHLVLKGFCLFAVSGVGAQELRARIDALPQRMTCTATQTAGFHDYPHNSQGYEAVVFFESSFTLTVNRVLMNHLATTSAYDLFLSLTQDGEVIELQCSQVRARGNHFGVSCSSQPPADLLLLNLDNLRFTRTAIGGWTFSAIESPAANTPAPSATNAEGESIYVEYGRCEGASG